MTLSVPSLDNRTLSREGLDLFGNPNSAISELTRDRALYMASCCGVILPDWIMCLRFFFRNDRRWRLMARAGSTSSWQIQAFGDRSASGWGRVVLRSREGQKRVAGDVAKDEDGDQDDHVNLPPLSGSGKPVSRGSRRGFLVVGLADMTRISGMDSVLMLISCMDLRDYLM